jgi:protein-S-isoprenylcysteine O-methyltransferase Ste14
MMITATYILMAVVSCTIYRFMRPKQMATTDNRIPTPKAFRAFYIYLVVASVATIILCPNWTHPMLLQWHQSVQLGWCGALISLAGIAVFVWSMAHLAAQYSPCYDAKLPSQIISTGPYSRIRHPVYTANLLTIAGGMIASGSLWMVLNFVVLFAFYVNSARIEERALSFAFTSYDSYRSNTGRFFPRFTRSTS